MTNVHFKMQSYIHVNRPKAYISYPGSFCKDSLSTCYFLFPLQSAVTEVNPKSVVVCVWTFETNGCGHQSRDNPSRLCKYQSACLELNVNALIWNANCVLCDMSKHWRAALWDGKLKVCCRRWSQLALLLFAMGDRYFLSYVLGALVGNSWYSRDWARALVIVSWNILEENYCFCITGMLPTQQDHWCKTTGATTTTKV